MTMRNSQCAMRNEIEEMISREDLESFGRLCRGVMALNRQWSGRREYGIEYYGGKYIQIWWLPWIKNNADRNYIIPKDTPADLKGLMQAWAAVIDEFEVPDADGDGEDR